MGIIGSMWTLPRLVQDIKRNALLPQNEHGTEWVRGFSLHSKQYSGNLSKGHLWIASSSA